MTMHARFHAPLLIPLAAALLLAGCATAAGIPQPATGSIEGVIQHPAHVVPAMRICALPTAQPGEPHRCTNTRASDDTYRIDGLPPGEYQVFAEAARGMYRHGGHMQAVQCIRAPCPDQPKTITLAADVALGGIDLTFFDETRADFPALPPAR